MQKFVAELSNTIVESEFERSWGSDQSLDGKPKVDFTLPAAEFLR